MPVSLRGKSVNVHVQVDIKAERAFLTVEQFHRTTVGYGDYPPTSDWGKLLISVYCIVAIPVFSMLLEPAKDYLEDLCRVETSSLPIKVD